MASILVYTDRSQLGGPTPLALATLGCGRELASHLGATLYGVAAPREGDDGDRWIRHLGEAGADKVVLLTNVDRGGPETWSSHGPGLAAAASELEPRILLLSANRAGDELGPRLAARLGGLFLSGPLVVATHDGTAEFRMPRARYDLVLAGSELAVPLVATLGWHRPVRGGDDDADVLFFDSTEPSDQRLIHRSSEGTTSPVACAEVIVTGGAGAADNWEEVAALARVLRAELARTAHAARLGLGPDCPIIDLGAQRVSPRLYFACGASGSERHMRAISPQTTIIALDRNPAACIMRLARYAMIGDLEATARDLASAVERGAP